MAYYVYRTLTPEQRAELVRERVARGFPPHSPPHPVRDQAFYLLTATCYEHVRHMATASRRQQLLDALFEAFIRDGMEIRAWAVGPNHYHLLAEVSEFALLAPNFRFVHSRLASQWNDDDGTPGRQVWYRFADRAIRSERHYYTTLNYIHYNPVKHHWSESPYEWAGSSVHWYEAELGREWLRDCWAKYPLRAYGRGWDDE